MPVQMTSHCEITSSDFCLRPEFAQSAGILPWKWELESNFSDRRTISNNAEDRAYQTSVMDFLAENMTGPFYVCERDSMGGNKTLSVTMLKKYDIAAFEEAFPEWNKNEEAYDQNVERLFERTHKGWKPQNPVLSEFVRYDLRRIPI